MIYIFQERLFSMLETPCTKCQPSMFFPWRQNQIWLGKVCTTTWINKRGNIFQLNFLYFFLGFTDEGNPCIMDSAGYIRLLNPNFGSSVWIQVCDSKSVSKGKSDHFFMVGANLEEFSARCILVKGKIMTKVIVMSIQEWISLDNFGCRRCKLKCYFGHYIIENKTILLISQLDVFWLKVRLWQKWL